MAHITLSQLTTVLQRIVSWATGKFAAKNTYSGKIEYADMPVVVLASMGSELDGTSTQRPMSAGSTYYLPGGQGAGARIMFVDSNGTAVKISDPESNVIYCNAYTGLLYRWDASESDMVPVGGDVDGLRKVYVDNMDFSSLDTLYSGVYQVIDQTTQRIIGVLVASSDNRFGESPYFVTQWLFSNLLLSDEYSGSFNGYYTIGRAHIIHRFYNASNTSYSDVPLNTWSEWKVYGLTLDEMSEIFNSKVSTISINGGPAQTPNNGNVNLVIEAGAQGQKGDKGDTVVLDPQGLPQFTIVNDLVSGGEANALSAEMGKRLALLAGTYAEAWARSKAITVPFCWLWVETVNGAAISKPIWHVGSSTFVDAVGSVVSIAIAPPAEPVFSLDDSEDVLSGSTLNVTFFGTLHYIIDGGTEQTTSTSPLALTLNADTDIEAWVEDSIGLLSQHVTKSYSIAIDHKLVFKIKLSGDNSTEYVPVTYQPIPGFSSNTYTMSVDWGDGTVDNFSNKGFTRKGCSHTYTGAAGDEKTITLRGSAIPALYFGASATGMTSDNYGNADALVAILENTLECDTYITINGGCSSLSSDALSNNVGTKALRFSGITSFPTGLLNHLSKTGITEFSNMFIYGVATFTAENMQELRESLASATDCISMFYGFNGVCSLPSNLFDLVGNGAITSCRYMTHIAKSGLTGDAKALYDVLSTKVTSSATTTGCFNATSLTNRNQVPNAWGGTAG